MAHKTHTETSFHTTLSPFYFSWISPASTYCLCAENNVHTFLYIHHIPHHRDRLGGVTVLSMALIVVDNGIYFFIALLFLYDPPVSFVISPQHETGLQKVLFLSAAAPPLLPPPPPHPPWLPGGTRDDQASESFEKHEVLGLTICLFIY